MPDGYQLPAIVLTALLLPAFAQLYLRSRDKRTLLWLLGFSFACLRMLQVYDLGFGNFSLATEHPWIVAAGQCVALISAILFLASLAPLSFRLGSARISYAVPFAIPLLIYAVLIEGVYGGQSPASAAFLIFPALGAISLLVGCFWAFAKGSLPNWLALGLCIATGGMSLWICVAIRGSWPLVFVESVLHITTAILIFYVFRRISPGSLLAALGFIAWSLTILMIAPAVAHNPHLLLALLRVSAMGKVVAAVGMILLTLEDQVAATETAEDRERRARLELEAYAKVVLSRRRIEDFDRQANLICQAVAEHSRFSQAALILLQSSGQYRLAGSSGVEDSVLTALESLTTRISPQSLILKDSLPPVVDGSQSVALSLQPWFVPGDDLERLHITQVIAAPLYGRSTTEGALLLMGMRNPEQPLRAEDMLPVEVLASRIQAARSQTMMLEKLIDAEKFAGLGQLANNVTRQLNNPLTVILGYASLLEVAPNVTPQERKAIEAILSEARNMRSTLESLSRMSRSQSDNLTAISITELLNDMEQLHRSEFVHRSIDFRLHIAPALPRALGNAQQVRQAVLYCLQFAIEAVENIDSPTEKSVRIEATSENDTIKILIAHTGPGFLHPARAFDPFVPAQAAGETAGLGLSLCGTILRENNGRISAMNFQPRGAGIVLELQAA